MCCQHKIIKKTKFKNSLHTIWKFIRTNEAMSDGWVYYHMLSEYKY